MARTYKRDSRGRFASGGGSSGGGGASRGGKKAATRLPAPRTGGTEGKPKRGRGHLVARAAVRDAKRNLADKSSSGASTRSIGAAKGAVTKARKKLDAARKTGTIRLTSRPGIISGRRGGARSAASAAASLSSGRKPNAKAQRIKELVHRKGTISGHRFNNGNPAQTMSLAEMRTALRQYARGRARAGASITRSDFAKVITGGKYPKTRGEWEAAYNRVFSNPSQGQYAGRRNQPGIINGFNIHDRSARAARVLGLDDGYTKASVTAAYRRLARQVHPDVGGRSRDMKRLTELRDEAMQSVEFRDRTKGRKSKSPKSRTSASPSANPSGPLLLPPAKRSASGKPRRRRK